MHVHLLHWLMSTGLLSLNAFFRPCKSMTGEMAPKEGSKLVVGPDMALIVSVHVCLGLVVEYWPFVGACTHHTVATLNSTICVFFLLCFSFCHHPPHPRTPPALPLIYTCPILMNSIKIVKNWRKPFIIYL